MRKIQKIINRDIIFKLSFLGHMDKVAIIDCGTPIPNNIDVIDLSIERGVPTFISIMKLIIEEMHIEKLYLANEIYSNNKVLANELIQLFPESELSKNIAESTNKYNHKKLKNDLKDCKFIIRTGDDTPYANIILQSGIIF